MPLEAYTTSVVGSYSVPYWYEALERQVEAGQFRPEDMADAQYRASQAAILDQEAAGVDVVNAGEMHRRTNNRHAPANAMLNYFWERIPGFSSETRDKPITVQHPEVTHPAAVLKGKIQYAPLGLVEEYEMVSRYARRPPKVTMTGPHMLGKLCVDEYYGDITEVMHDLAAVINRNFRELAQAGCRHIQLDEPLFAAVDREEVEAAVDAGNQCFEGVDAYKWMHVCHGNYVASDHTDEGELGHRYFDLLEYPSDLVAKIDVDALMVEYDVADTYLEVLGNQQLAIGAVDVQDLTVESPERIMQRVEAQRWLAPEQTLLTTTCGLNHLPRHVAFGKLEALAQARDRLRSRQS